MNTGVKVDFWNVGQGDSSSISRPDGSIDIIDAGPIGNPQLCDYLTLNAKKVNALVITHNDSDHIGGLLALLNIPNVHIEKAYLLVDGHKLKRMPAFKRLVDKLGTGRIARIESKVVIDEFDGYKLIVRHPDFCHNVMSSSSNNTSAVLSLTWNDQDVIVWGADNRISTIRQNVGPHIPMLFGPHHGAPGDVSCKSFDGNISALSPRQCFLSYGTRNSHNHPSLAYIKALRRLDCRITCSQRCMKCGRTDEQAILDGDGYYLLLPPKQGLACHGHVRLEVHGLEVHDELEIEYEAAKQKARKRLCK